MRIMPTSVARAAKRARTRSDWRPLTTGEAGVAAVVDVLLLIVVVVIPMLALNVKALPWILLAQVIMAQSLVLARFGRTAGLATVSATVVVPQQGAAPGIGRALVRVLLPFLLPFQISPRRSAGQSDEDRERLLDRLTGTLTVTRRPMPEQARPGSAGRTRTKPRRSKRGSTPVATPPMAPEAMTRGPMHGGGQLPSANPTTTGAPMFQPPVQPAPFAHERPDLVGPAYTGAFAGTGVPAGPAPVAASSSGATQSRFAPPVASPAPPPSTAHSPVAPTPPPASLPPSSVPAAPDSSPVTPSVFAAPSGPPTSSMPIGAAPSATSAPPSAPAPQAPAHASPSLPPPSLPPRIQPARQQTVSPPPPAVGSAPSATGGAYAAAHGIRSGAPDAPGGPLGPRHAQPPVIPPSSAASAVSSSSRQYPPTPSASGGPDASAPAGPPSVQPRGRQPKAM